MASPSSVITKGFGTPGSAALVITRGFGIKAASPPISGNNRQRGMLVNPGRGMH